MGFNSILAYEYGTHDLPAAKAFLDRAAAAKLQVFYALNGFLNVPPYNQPHGTNWTISIVSSFKDHPALGAWYICDERPVKYLPILEARHELVRNLDPAHITYSVLDSTPPPPPPAFPRVSADNLCTRVQTCTAPYYQQVGAAGGDLINEYTNTSETLGVDPYPWHHDGDNVTSVTQ
jgi:hypothetical protein